jgi:CheY-like chemotaxis protein
MALCLIVDDDLSDCKAAADIAMSVGLEVRVENNARAALVACGEKMPDIVILDIMMPQMDGVEFLNALHKKIGGRRPHVIVSTALSDVATITSLKKEGINGYILKPYKIDNLIGKLKESGLVK